MLPVFFRLSADPVFRDARPARWRFFKDTLGFSPSQGSGDAVDLTRGVLIPWAGYPQAYPQNRLGTGVGEGTICIAH